MVYKTFMAPSLIFSSFPVWNSLLFSSEGKKSGDTQSRQKRNFTPRQRPREHLFPCLQPARTPHESSHETSHKGVHESVRSSGSGSPVLCSLVLFLNQKFSLLTRKFLVCLVLFLPFCPNSNEKNIRVSALWSRAPLRSAIAILDTRRVITSEPWKGFWFWQGFWGHWKANGR